MKSNPKEEWLAKQRGDASWLVQGLAASRVSEPTPLYHAVVKARDWLKTLPAALSAQRDLLSRLLDAVERDPKWRWLLVGCSVAEGRADHLSDIDLGLGVADEAWDAAAAELPALLEDLDPVVGALYHRLPQLGNELHLRAFVQYVNGVQMDLVALPAHAPKGHKPEDVVLYDPDSLLGEPWDPAVLQATPEAVYEWTFLAWVALADLAKYLERGSHLEALERLEQTRTQIWRLRAVANELRYPGFGLTAILDHPEVPLPPRIDETAAHANSCEIFQAARVSAAILEEISLSAAVVIGACLPTSLAAFVTRRLESLANRRE